MASTFHPLSPSIQEGVWCRHNHRLTDFVYLCPILTLGSSSSTSMKRASPEPHTHWSPFFLQCTPPLTASHLSLRLCRSALGPHVSPVRDCKFQGKGGALSRQSPHAVWNLCYPLHFRSFPCSFRNFWWPKKSGRKKWFFFFKDIPSSQSAVVLIIEM